MNPDIPLLEESIITNASYMHSLMNPPLPPPFPSDMVPKENFDPPYSHDELTSYMHGIMNPPMPPPLPSNTVPTDEFLSTSDLAQTVGVFIQELFVISGEKPNFDKFLGLAPVFGKLLKGIKPCEIEVVKCRFQDHVGVYKNGNPWIDLEAAWLLNLHSDLWKPEVPRPMPKNTVLSNKVKEALLNGRHVPIQHILHDLTLSRFNPEMENYPFSFTQPLPIEFLEKINRSDVIRGANVHITFMSIKFPLVAAHFLSIVDELWHFMFPNKFSALAGMELYNEFFFEFSCNLGRGIVAALNSIPSSLSERVASKYTSSFNTIRPIQFHST